MRNAVIYVAAGIMVGGVIAWVVTHNDRRQPALSEAAITRALPFPPAQSLDSVPRIALPDLRQGIDRAEVVVVDVRDADAYLAAHIPGAIHIPLAYIQRELPYLPHGKPIVTYCT